MVKGYETLKSTELYPLLFAKLREALSRPSFVQFRTMDEQPSLTQVTKLMPIDAVANVEIHGKAYQIIAGAKANGQPMSARRAIEQLRYYMAYLPPTVRKYGVFLAPFVSPEAAQICLESGVGYVDLAGNAHLEFADVFVEIRTAENPFKELRENRPLFSSKSERVLRVLLTPPLRSWKVTELSQVSRVSLGQVSTVRRHLLDREWATADNQGLTIIQPEELARAWQAAYKPRRETEKRYTLLHGASLEQAIKSAIGEAFPDKHLVLASFSAARWMAPFARQNTTYFYATKTGKAVAERFLELQSAAQGENVVIWYPKEDDVFSSSIEVVPGIRCSSQVQTWLDLSLAGDRGKEAAEHLLQQELIPAWRSALG